MLALSLAAQYAPLIEERHFPYYPDRHENQRHLFAADSEGSNSQRHHNRKRKSDPCQNPANKDAPFCQKPAFLRANQKIPIIWKYRKTAVSPINNDIGGSLQLRDYDSSTYDQEWIFVPVNPDFNNSLYYITNAATALALTASAFASPLTLQANISAQNQMFYLRPQIDGSFYIVAYGSGLYLDVQQSNAGSLPVLIIRNWQGSVTQKWLLN